MQRYRQFVWFIAAVCVIGVSALAWSADFTQPERTADFAAACRRQDKKLKTYFSEMIPGDLEFQSQGCFRVQVHREGLDRTLKIIPVRSIAYPDFDSFQEAARQKNQVAGVLLLTYTIPEPFIVPGTHLMIYDGYKVHILDVHGYDQAALEATLGPVPPDAVVDPVLGSLGKTTASLATITSEGTFQLYLQLTDADGNALTNPDGTPLKCLLEISLPGCVTDDDSPARKLATPPAEK